MTDSTVSPSKRMMTLLRRPIFTRTILGISIFVLLFGVFGHFVLPSILKSQAEQLIATKLQRTATIGKIEINPFSMVVTVRDFKLMEPKATAVFASFETLQVNLSAQSLWRLAPVVQAVRLEKPSVHLVRTAPHQYNIDDLLALSKQQETPQQASGPARFALYNLQLDAGHISFDDQVTGSRQQVAALQIGLPFISSLHSQVDIFVEPLLSATVNGTPLLLKGKLKPFADRREAVVDLNLDGLDLTQLVEYLPFKPSFNLAEAQLETKLSANFSQPHGQAPVLSLSGVAAIKSLRLTAPDGKTFLKLPELSVTLDRAPLLSQHYEVARVLVQGLEAQVSRDRQGHIDVQRWLAFTTPAVSDAPRAAAALSAAPKSSSDAGMAPTVTLGELAIRGAKLSYADQSASAPMTADVEKFDATLHKLQIDTGKKNIVIAKVLSSSANLQLKHEKREVVSTAAPPIATTSLPTSASTMPPTTSAAAPAHGKSAAEYVVEVGSIAIENWRARLEDRSQAKLALTQLEPISLSVSGLSTKPKTDARISFEAAVNRSGRLALNGAVGMQPLHADLKLDLKEVDLLPLQPYITEYVNLQLTRAGLSGKGTLQLQQDHQGELRGGFKGDLSLGNLSAVDKLTGGDFLRWKSLYFGGADVRLQPLSLTLEQVALSDFFARVIIDPSGRINLQDIVRSHTGERKSLTEASARTTVAGDAVKTPPTAAMPTLTAVAPEVGTKIEMATSAAQAATVPPIKIAKFTLQGGRVRFTDNFIKPNYSANLTNIGGVVSGLSSDPASNASVDLRGEVNSAPLTVVGSINPLRGDLTMNLKGEVRDMELAPLSPYSGRYVGYGIEKGKLSFDVNYKIEQRKLIAENRLILDQLTFGDKVDSPDAPNLPVQLAVALLRDRNGVIDINLPVAGSLDDPQFSMGGIIVKVIVNLIAKAVTAPFALLGSLFGGGEELSWLDFEAGRAAIPAAGEAKLKTLAKALTDRPALKLEISAHIDAEAESEGMKRAAITRKLRALKLKNLLASGEVAPEGGVTIKPEEYAALLSKVYKDESFPKPRNMLGLQKDLPVVEMEKLMLSNTKIEANDLVALGNRRAQAVKDWLLKNGQIPGERIYLIATKIGATEAKSGSTASASRVDFSLK